MPSSRATLGRDFTAVALQFDPTTNHEARYTAVRRRNNRLAGDSLTAPRRTGAGWAVTVRNGLPFKPYVYRGTGRDQMETQDA